jgi:predicted ATP-binding protein involved in virulence
MRPISAARKRTSTATKKHRQGRGTVGKVPVFGLRDRGGQVIVQVVKSMDSVTLVKSKLGSNMNLTQIELKHFRGANDLTFNLDANLNVFYGNNGAGKSTILDAAAIALSWLANRIRTEKSSGRSIQEVDIQNEKQQCSIKISGEHSNSPFWIHPAKVRRGHAVEGWRTSLSIRPLVEKIQTCLSTKQCAIPLLAYYPVNRAVLDIPLRIRVKHEFDRLDAYDNSLTSAANFRTFFEWFRDREDIENAMLKQIREFDTRKLKKIRWDNYKDLQIDAVRTAIYAFMSGFSDLTVCRSPLRMEVKKDGNTLRVDQLSVGEKCLMAMVGDIARRLAIANPDHESPLDGDGIILIDEIDLHLHPRWQHIIIPQLTKTFRNCQFLISTHSPHVITHVPPEQLFSLDMYKGEITFERPRESYGKNVERILEDLMGLATTRPDDAEKRLKEIYALISNFQLEEAKEKVEQFRKIIGNDSELVRANVLIQRKELTRK